MQIIGYALFIIAHGYSAPITEIIYTQSECEIRLEYIKQHRPQYEYICGEVKRGN